MRRVGIILLLMVGAANAQTLGLGGRRSIAPSSAGGDNTITDDSVNVGNGTASVSTLIATCTGASKALTYDPATNAFGCNTISASIGSTIAMTGTTTTNTITSDTTAATASTTVGALTIAPTATLDANDLLLDVRSKASGGASKFTVDLEGDLTAGNIIFGGNAKLSSAGNYDVITANSAQIVGTTIRGNATNTGSSYGVVVDQYPSMSVSGAKLFTVANGGTDKMSIDKDGAFLSPASNTASNYGFVFNTINALNLSNNYLAIWRVAGGDRLRIDNNGAIQPVNSQNLGNTTYPWGAIYLSNGTSGYIQGTNTDGATAVALTLGPASTYSTAGAKMISFSNGGEKSFIDKDGLYSTSSGIRISTVSTLPTCASTVEGQIRWATGTGGTSGVRTQVCVCTSDGAGTPAYAWVNMNSGTVGTATACAI